MTEIGFLVKNEPWFEDKGQFFLLQNFKCIGIGLENAKSLSDCVLLHWYYDIRQVMIWAEYVKLI